MGVYLFCGVAFGYGSACPFTGCRDAPNITRGCTSTWGPGAPWRRLLIQRCRSQVGGTASANDKGYGKGHVKATADHRVPDAKEHPPSEVEPVFPWNRMHEYSSRSLASVPFGGGVRGLRRSAPRVRTFLRHLDLFLTRFALAGQEPLACLKIGHRPVCPNEPNPVKQGPKRRTPDLSLDAVRPVWSPWPICFSSLTRPKRTSFGPKSDQKRVKNAFFQNGFHLRDAQMDGSWARRTGRGTGRKRGIACRGGI